MAISTVIFDFGSTIIREEGFDLEEGMRFLLSRAVVPSGVGEKELREFDEKVFPDMLERRQYSGLDFKLTQYLHLLQFCLGIRFDGDLDEIAFGCWLREYRPRLEDGAVECLRDLRGKNIKVGLLSNTILSGKSVELGLKHLGIHGFFDGVLCSSDVGYRKPSDLIFRAILGLLNAKPESSAMVGDNLQDDIGGAASLGMTTVWYNPGRLAGCEIKPDHVVSDLRSVARALDLV